MNGGMAHGASLVLRRQVVGRPNRTLGRNGVALQAEQVDLAHPKKTRVIGAVRSMATDATFGFYRHVLKGEGAVLVHVALVAGSISVRDRPRLAGRAAAVHVMTVGTAHETLIHAVMVGPGELGLLSCVALVTELGLIGDQQRLFLFGMVR